MGLVLLLFLACDPGDVVLLAPETNGPPPTFSVRAVVDTPWAALADSLGWAAGVPGALVRIHRMDEPYDGYWHTATADSTGVATFGALLPGLYEVEVSRTLSSAEVGHVDSAAHLLAGGRRLSLPATSPPLVTMEPDHAGGLIFSKFGLTEPPPWETGNREYSDAKYFEVYNNSDTTIYLDGKYWGMGWHLNYNYANWPCTQTEAVRNDPDGIWASRIFRFPGRGTDYPLHPGEVALVAKAAVDHRAVHTGLYDLSGAAFEWGGHADNPDVPNLDDIGLAPMVVNWPEASDMPEFLSEPVDLASLPRYVDPSSGQPWVRIPAALVLDVWANPLDWTTESVDLGLEPCREQVHQRFERLPGPALAASDFDNGLSVQRRVLRVLPDGRKVLLDTNTSMVDFVKAVRTPGWIPDP